MKQLTILMAVCAMALFTTQTANADHGRGGYRGGYGGYGHYHGGYRGYYGGPGRFYGGPNVSIAFGNPGWGGYYGPGFYGGPWVAPVAPVYPVGGWGWGPGWGRPGCGGGFYYGW